VSLTEQHTHVTGEPVEQTNPNKDTIAGLIALAGFLTKHPGLPRVTWTLARFDVPYDNPRAAMELIAATMDQHGPVMETADSSQAKVQIDFGGGVDLHAVAYLNKLDAIQPPAPVYRPILIVCPHCADGRVEVDPVTGGYSECGTCDGRGYMVPDPEAVPDAA
jgi:hypothetical protein